MLRPVPHLFTHTASMKISVCSQLPPAVPDLVEFVFEDGPLPADVREAEFKGGFLTRCLWRGKDRRTLYVGLGKRSELGADRLRKAAGAASRLLVDKGARRLAFQLDDSGGMAGVVVDGALTGAYKFEDFLPKERQRKHCLEELILVVPADAVARAREEANAGRILGEAVNYVRHLGNQPPNVAYPARLAEEANLLACADGLTCRVFAKSTLTRHRFGGLLAVGGGSEKSPCLIELKYTGAPAKSPVLTIVGKAITFDSGGISLKPGENMDEMKYDKMGGCAVLGIMQAVARLKLPVNVVGLIATAENMPGPQAYRPGDIVTTYDGQTVEVLNTDAEGRMVLADALGYARRKLKPACLIDLATLTGACVVALGPHRSGLFTGDASLRDDLVSLGETTGDRVWPLPVGEEYDEDVKSDIATVKNTGGRWGGACTAASFLRTWVGDIPWAHLDIAGTAWLTTAKPWAGKGATGVGVRLVTEFARKWADAPKPAK